MKTRMDQSRQHIAGKEELKGDRAGRSELSHQPAWAAHVHEPSLHPALKHLFVAIRHHPVACILCWQNNGLLFHRVRAGSLSAAKSVATALRRTEQKGVGKWLVAQD